MGNSADVRQDLDNFVVEMKGVVSAFKAEVLTIQDELAKIKAEVEAIKNTKPASLKPTPTPTVAPKAKAEPKADLNG